MSLGIVSTRCMNAFFSVTTDGILSISERYLKWKLYIYSVGWVWKIKINDTCIDNSTLGNVQYLQFRLIYFVSKNWISPSRKTGFLQQDLHRKPLCCVGEQRRKIKVCVMQQKTDCAQKQYVFWKCFKSITKRIVLRNSVLRSVLQCETSKNCIYDRFISFHKVKPLNHHSFFQQSLHSELQSCIGEHKRKLIFCNWPFKVLKVREFQKVSWNCLHSMFERMFLRNYRLNIDFFEMVLNWNLGTFSVEWGWKIKFCDPRLEISTARNIQKRHFRLIFFVSRSQNSPWSQALIFLTRCASETSDLNRKTRKLINFFDRSIKILIARKFHEWF